MASYGIGDRTYNKSTLIKSELEPLQEGFVDASSPPPPPDSKTLINDRQLVKEYEGKWQDAVKGYYDLRDKSEILLNLQTSSYSASPSNMAHIETKNQKMMKMQYQNDLRNLSEANGNILVLGLIAGTCVTIFSVLLYMQ